MLTTIDVDVLAVLKTGELRACLEAMDPAFLRENIDVPPGATGAALIEAVVASFCHLLVQAALETDRPLAPCQTFSGTFSNRVLNGNDRAGTS